MNDNTIIINGVETQVDAKQYLMVIKKQRKPINWQFIEALEERDYEQG